MDVIASGDLLPDLSGITLSTLDDSHNIDKTATTTSDSHEESDDDYSSSNNASFNLFSSAELAELHHENRDMDVLLHKTSRRFQHASTNKLDDAMLDGTARDILQSLHRVMLVKKAISEKSIRNQPIYRSSLDYSRAVQVTILCRSLSHLTKCSEQAVKAAMETFGAGFLGPCLPQLLRIFASPTASSMDTNARVTTINSCLEIFRQTGHHLPPQAIIVIIDVLAQLLEPSLGLCCDVRVGAASCIARTLEYDTMVDSKSKLLELIQEHSAAIISILGTAALVVTGDLLDKCLIGLCRLAQYPPLSRKVAQRRCAILAIRQHVFHNSLEVRITAITLCEAVLSGCAVVGDESESGRETESMLISTLMRASMDEVDVTVKMSTIEILRGLISAGDTTNNSDRTANILRILRYHSVMLNADPKVAVMTSLYYLKATDKIPLTKEIAVVIVEYLSSAYVDVRLAAIRTLNDMTFWDPEAAVYFIDKTELLNTMAYLVVHGSQAEAADIMAVCEQILFDQRVHRLISQHPRLLEALVGLVTTDPVVNRQAFSKAVTVILELMSNDENLPYFKRYPKILPWLVGFANRTTDDDSVKRKVVSAIVRLSTSFLVD